MLTSILEPVSPGYNAGELFQLHAMWFGIGMGMFVGIVGWLAAAFAPRFGTRKKVFGGVAIVGFVAAATFAILCTLPVARHTERVRHEQVVFVVNAVYHRQIKTISVGEYYAVVRVDQGDGTCLAKLERMGNVELVNKWLPIEFYYGKNGCTLTREDIG